ncbi:uncharacterized protein DEA37_0003116 [Paragonimus westermani]|uniref:Uncharacterized protein n=1 Tax=Paragonimus westermani TaxID=34504 RepID=A0A5J4P0K0_9TREM|nr:uncharacterized protein DEA37_0003116 [Paragonimus westermani]
MAEAALDSFCSSQLFQQPSFQAAGATLPLIMRVQNSLGTGAVGVCTDDLEADSGETTVGTGGIRDSEQADIWKSLSAKSKLIDSDRSHVQPVNKSLTNEDVHLHLPESDSGLSAANRHLDQLRVDGFSPNALSRSRQNVSDWLDAYVHRPGAEWDQIEITSLNEQNSHASTGRKYDSDLKVCLDSLEVMENDAKTVKSGLVKNSPLLEDHNGQPMPDELSENSGGPPPCFTRPISNSIHSETNMNSGRSKDKDQFVRDRRDEAARTIQLFWRRHRRRILAAQAALRRLMAEQKRRIVQSIPNVQGMPIREAILKRTQAKQKCRMEGHRKTIQQTLQDKRHGLREEADKDESHQGHATEKSFGQKQYDRNTTLLQKPTSPMITPTYSHGAENPVNYTGDPVTNARNSVLRNGQKALAGNISNTRLNNAQKQNSGGIEVSAESEKNVHRSNQLRRRRQSDVLTDGEQSSTLYSQRQNIECTTRSGYIPQVNLEAEITLQTLSMQLEERTHSVQRLQNALEQQRELSLRQLRDTQRDAQQRSESIKADYESTITRNYKLIDELIEEKKTLHAKCESLMSEMKTLSQKAEEKLKVIEDRHKVELRKAEARIVATEKLRREKWETEKAKQMKMRPNCEKSGLRLDPNQRHALSVAGSDPAEALTFHTCVSSKIINLPHCLLALPNATRSHRLNCSITLPLQTGC